MAKVKTSRPKPLEATLVDIDQLKPHPRNYRTHSDEQIEHICQSIRQHGFYRNIVTAKDLTILAGHGSVLAARKMGIKRVPVVRIPVAPDDPRALKVLPGDNEIGLMAEVDDRVLSELLKEVRDAGELLGTGYTDEQLVLLAMVTRPASEIRGLNEAAEWVGMPDFERHPEGIKVIISLETRADLARLGLLLGVNFNDDGKKMTFDTWYPPHEREDLSSVQFEEAAK